MKKIIIFIFTLFLVGCSKNNYITCNIEVENKIENYNMNGIYKIYYKNNFVTNIEKKETYISHNQGVIEYFNEVKNLEYYNLNDLYNGFSYEIINEENSVGINVVIDLELVNIKQMVKDKKLDKDYVVSNKLTTSGIVNLYESKGAICDI